MEETSKPDKKISPAWTTTLRLVEHLINRGNSGNKTGWWSAPELDQVVKLVNFAFLPALHNVPSESRCKIWDFLLPQTEYPENASSIFSYKIARIHLLQDHERVLRATFLDHVCKKCRRIWIFSSNSFSNKSVFHLLAFASTQNALISDTQNQNEIQEHEAKREKWNSGKLCTRMMWYFHITYI